MHLVLPPVTAVPALLSILCVFVLRSCVFFVACWVLALLVTSATLRFAIWLGYLASTAAYWVWSIRQSWLALAPVSSVSGSTGAVRDRALLLSQREAHIAATALSLCVLVYIGVQMALAAVSVYRRYLLWRALRNRTAAPEYLQQVCAELTEETGAPESELWLLPALSSPASLGWLRPAVYMPADSLISSAVELRDVLRHEISHLRRRDGLWDVVSRICLRILFFHPLAWYTMQQLRLNRELATDRDVVQHSSSTPDAYAEMLLRFGWRVAPGAEGDLFGIQFAAQSTVLKTRIRAILEGEPVCSAWSKVARAVLGSGACWGFFALMPLLYISFALPGIGIQVREAIPAHVTSIRQKRRVSVRTREAVGSQATSVQAVEPIVVAAVSEVRGANRGYQLLPGPSAAMSDQSADLVAANGAENSASTRRGIAAGPKPPERSLSDEVALGLSRLSTRGHDHDDH